MMSHQFYEQAAKCFRAADNILLESKALAYFKASQASELISAEKKRWWPAKNRNFKKECKEIEEKAKNEFISAGNEFLRISEIDEKEFMLKEAARCFASAKENERAADIYQSIGLISQAAEAYLASGHYEAAGDLFTEKFEYIRAIDAYRCGRKWDKLVHCIYKCRNNMADKERQKFIKKYVPLALENLMPQAFLTLDEDKNTIVEEKEEENEEEKEEPASEESFSLIQESHNSFTLIGNSADSFSMIKDDDEIFEVLQDIDPKDEWLISDSGSVIDSLSPTLNKDSILSDYSIIDNPHTASLNQGGKLINTKTDIFIEDQAMLKIIEYVGMFSSDVSSFLNSFKSAESLISTQKIAESWELIDLDEISPELLGIILDALEEFGMYKLCLFVCNRYQLEERLGRYVVSVAFKYSNNPLLKPSDLNKPNFIKAQSQRANLAFSAVHNVLEMINPEYLALKKDFDGKNLGIESFRGLLLLGYWKKTVYIMDRENSLAVTSSFMDFKNFKNIYLIFENSDFLEKINEESFAWLPFNTPSNYEEVRAAKIALDSVICSLNTLYFVTQKSTCSSIKKFPNFPEYFFYNENFWKFIHKQDDSVLMNCFRQSVGEIKDFLRGKGFKEIIDECRAWDALSFFTQLLLGSNYQPAIKSFLQKLPYEDFEEILLISSMAIKLLCFNAQVLDSRYSTLVFAMLAPLGIRQLISSPAMAAFPYFSHVLMHKNNILLQSINLSDIERVYTVDTEGQFLILPIENILKAFSKEIVTSLTSIIKERNIYPKSKKYPETASALINRYGELWMINFINSHIDGNPYKLENLSSAFLKESIEYKEYSINKKRLQRIIDLADGDRKSINFIKKQNKKEIAFLEKEIQKYKDNSVENKENLLNLIIEKCSFMPKAEVKLTKLASHALFSQAQIFMELSGKSNEPTEIVEELFMSYELCKLSGYSIYFHEMLNQRLKPTISASGEKMFKNHSFYHHAVAYLDIDSYFDQGSFESASTSILSLLNAQFFEIDIEQVIKLTEKAVICWAISLGTPIKLSKFHNKYLPKSQYTRNGDIIIKGVAQGKRPSISAELFEWTVKILSQINKSDTSIKSKSRLASKIYGFLLLIIQYGNPSILYESMTKVQLNREFELIGITNEIQEIAEIANLAALEEYQAISQSSPLKNGEIMVIHEELISEEESLQRLNNSWISETRLFAAHHEKVYILRKLKKYRKRVQRSNIQQQILFSSLSSKVQETLSFKKDWKSKNFLKIISIIEEFQAEINDCIYKASLKKPLDFHYLLKQMNWLLTVFSSIINCITSQDIDCSETIKNSIQEIEAAIKRMNLWKNVIILQNKEIEIKHQKKWNFKWRQEIMNKRKKGIKRQEALMKKRDKLKSS
ncbi:unnamed protein product [Blepharisma stoltei]|uniref:Uncharacterized protein n=1 Tax=Blepharisma stoltei TaxID=1481888 RepID=A0AAU9J638_9CILI|nr:unnamed protein product [Blepharisma stoltei]